MFIGEEWVEWPSAQTTPGPSYSGGEMVCELKRVKRAVIRIKISTFAHEIKGVYVN